MYEIILAKNVEKYLDKLNSKDRERIINSLDNVCERKSKSFLEPCKSVIQR